MQRDQINTALFEENKMQTRSSVRRQNASDKPCPLQYVRKALEKSKANRTHKVARRRAAAVSESRYSD
uniref:Uncharacterized protein n=1 Tax=Anguilla anguilla TaxID=7936 RepID=A0A0E9TR17_ANGAN